VSTRRPEGDSRTVGQLPAGSIFGEIGLLHRVPRTATVTAEEACSLLRIDGDDFLDALSSDPLEALVQDLARRRLAETQPPSVNLEPVV
jgi:CRP-like cAMP-binding protein